MRQLREQFTLFLLLFLLLPSLLSLLGLVPATPTVSAVSILVEAAISASRLNRDDAMMMVARHLIHTLHLIS